MKESLIYKHLKTLSCYFRFLRVETSTEKGVPDIYYWSINGKNISGFIELKQGKGTPEKGVLIPYREGQQLFLKNYHKNNTRCFVFVSLEKVNFLTTCFNSVITKEDFLNYTVWNSCSKKWYTEKRLINALNGEQYEHRQNKK